MALADYFDKAALAAAHVLRGFDIAVFTRMLETSVIAVDFDDAAAVSIEGRATLDLTVRLLARLYPNLVVHTRGRGSEATELVTHLQNLARTVNPHVDLTRHGRVADVTVAVGDTPVPTGGNIVYTGSDGWVARLDRSRPVGSSMTDNPFGAGAAACLAAANVFRAVFAEFLEHGALDETVTFSLLNLERGDAGAGQDVGAVDVGETHLAGAGAIAHGTVWALARLPEVHGTLHTTDPETLDLGNLQRYVLASNADLGTIKVELLRRAFTQPRLRVEPHPKSWGAYLLDRGDWHLQRVLVALDSVDDRIAVQASLPRWIANAWTQTGDLGVSRHDFLNGACLACLYVPHRPDLSESHRVARALGLPDEEPQIRDRLYRGVPADRDLLRRAARALGVNDAILTRFEGQPLRTFYTDAVCGGVILRAGGQAQPDAMAEAPLAFQSALAGVLLAAELVKHALNMTSEPAGSISTFDVLRPFGRHFTQRRAKLAPRPNVGRCLCLDPAYVEQYRHKYG